MTLVDPIGDMFTRIRNGQMRNLNSVNIPASKFRSKILEILKDGLGESKDRATIYCCPFLLVY